MHKKCSICGEPFEGHGHNSLPLAKGRCCDVCNILVIELICTSLRKTSSKLTKCEVINLILKIRPNYPSSFLWRSKRTTLLKFYTKLKEYN